jgi:hypothetical protein
VRYARLAQKVAQKVAQVLAHKLAQKLAQQNGAMSGNTPFYGAVAPGALGILCAWLPFGLVIVLGVVVCDLKYIHIKINHLIDS